MRRCGRYTLAFDNKPVIISGAGICGKAEGEGPLCDEFDFCYPDDGIGQKSWEAAESELLKKTGELALSKANIKPNKVDVIFSGDLLNQCTGSIFAFRDLGVPMVGLYGACSTFALGLCMAGAAVESGAAGIAVATASSHFCSAEKQFRYPLEYGGQRPPAAQRTVTGAGACVVANKNKGVCIEYASVGRICDLGVTDVANMGAAMAPSAAQTIAGILTDTHTSPEDYDLILTGDLGVIGSDMLVKLLNDKYRIKISMQHNDCGKMIYNIKEQDMHSGGSGCGCSASVFSTRILRLLSQKKLNRIIFAGTGALMSPLTSLQGETIPGITHGVVLSFKEA